MSQVNLPMSARIELQQAAEGAAKVDRVKTTSGEQKERIENLEKGIIGLEKNLRGDQSLTKAQKKILIQTEKAKEQLQLQAAKSESKLFAKEIKSSQGEIQEIRNEMEQAAKKLQHLNENKKNHFWQKTFSEDKINRESNKQIEKMRAGNEAIIAHNYKLTTSLSKVEQKTINATTNFNDIHIITKTRLKEAGTVRSEYNKAKMALQDFEKREKNYVGQSLIGFDSQMGYLKKAMKELKEVESTLVKKPIELDKKANATFIEGERQRREALSKEIADAMKYIESALADGTKKTSIGDRIKNTLFGEKASPSVQKSSPSQISLDKLDSDQQIFSKILNQKSDQ